MAKSTYLELCQKVRQECSIPGTGPSSVDAQTGILQRIVTWVADSDYLIQSAYADWNFLWAQYSTSTIVDTANYVAPSDLGVWDVDSFYLNYTATDYKKLRMVDYKTYRSRYRNGTQTTAEPSYFAVLPDHSITLHSVPDAVYTLTADYYSLPTRLASNTDTSAIPERFEQAIIALSKAKFAEEEGAPVLLQNAMQEYAFWMDELKKHELQDQVGRAHARPEAMVVMPV